MPHSTRETCDCPGRHRVSVVAPNRNTGRKLILPVDGASWRAWWEVDIGYPAVGPRKGWPLGVPVVVTLEVQPRLMATRGIAAVIRRMQDVAWENLAITGCVPEATTTIPYLQGLARVTEAGWTSGALELLLAQASGPEALDAVLVSLGVT